MRLSCEHVIYSTSYDPSLLEELKDTIVQSTSKDNGAYLFDTSTAKRIQFTLNYQGREFNHTLDFDLTICGNEFINVKIPNIKYESKHQSGDAGGEYQMIKSEYSDIFELENGDLTMTSEKCKITSWVFYTDSTFLTPLTTVYEDGETILWTTGDSTSPILYINTNVGISTRDIVLQAMTNGLAS